MAIKEIKKDEVFDFERDSEAFLKEEDGELVFVEENTPREYFDENGDRIGVLLERSNTNHLKDSLNPQEQTVSLPIGDYTFSAIGQGDVEISYGGQTITYTGTPVSFSLTQQTDVTVKPLSDTLKAFQLEDGLSPSSIIVTPPTTSGTRGIEALTHGRGKWFSRNSGTFVGMFHVHEEVEEGAVYFHVENEDGSTFSIKGRGESFVFDLSGGDEIEFLNPVPADGIIRFAIVYYAREGYIRCYLGEEVGELDIPYIVPSLVSWGNVPYPKKMIVSRYEYRPRAMNNKEVGRLMGYEYELAYDFEVSPDQVSDWADRIFAASLFGL